TAFGKDKMFEANGGLPYGIQDARGYDSVIIGRYAQLNGLLEPQDQLQFNRVKTLDDPKALDSPLLDLPNVKYVLSSQPIDDPKFRQVYAGPDGRVYENTGVLPRAFVVGDVQVVGDASGQLAALSSPGFDPGRKAVIDKGISPSPQPSPSGSGSENAGVPQASTAARGTENGGVRQASPAARGTENGGAQASTPAGGSGTGASVTDYSGRKVTVRAAGPGLLVLTDNNFPGWKANVDGEPAELVTADYTFRGVPLGEGEHTVEFTFSPQSVI